MDTETLIAPAPANSGASGYIELSRTKSGKLIRKHILSTGDLIHPVTKKKIPITDETLTSLSANFEANVCPIVQIPLADDKNAHSEDPSRNLGEVVGLSVEDGKLYATLDVRKSADDFGKTILGASAMFHLDYEDTRTGQKVGPTLLHVCATNRPYVTDLDPYEELVAATAEGSDDVVVLTPAVATDGPDTDEGDTMTLEEMLAALKADHDIDVPALLATAEEAQSGSGDATALSNTLSQALTTAGVIQLSAGAEVTDEMIVGAVAEMATTNVSLSNRLNSLEDDKRVARVDALIGEGKILPAQKDAFLTLSRSNPELFEQMVPAEAVVKLSRETGVTPEFLTPEMDVDAEIARLSASAAEQGLVKAPTQS